ncbi:MAG: hypothetical protein KKE62_19785 [Proteobacteria bacterium]|nr:hypothetical protein [Pseudomonadota bacterium]MBU1387592.1 hypothetical protein [Pseudomonadota bacterium]MBU1545082.1 hypothetical protein [Pseudomonadota bacterium]
MAFVKSVMGDATLGVTLNTSNTKFTGHSLGGSLAGMASYVYGFEAYTYNGFGINNMLWSADDTSSVDHPYEMVSIETGVGTQILDLDTLGEYLEAEDIPVTGTTSQITNIIHAGFSDTDLVGGILTDIISGQAGSTYFVANHSGETGLSLSELLSNHDKTKLNESIAVYNNILTLFPDSELDYNALTDVLNPIIPENQRVESFLKTLGAIVSAPSATDHVVWSENIKNSGVTGLVLTSLTGLTNNSLAASATNDIATRYALTRLNPFIITGDPTLYDQLNIDGKLEIDDGSNGGQLTDQYIQDRSKFLHALMDSDNSSYNDIAFTDKSLDVEKDPASLGIDTEYWWGTDDHDVFLGITNFGDDHIYGMGGGRYTCGFRGERLY